MSDIEKLASEHCESFYEDGNGAIEEYSFKPTQLLQFAEAYHAEQQNAAWNCNDVNVKNCNPETLEQFCRDNIILAPFFTLLANKLSHTKQQRQEQEPVKKLMQRVITEGSHLSNLKIDSKSKKPLSPSAPKHICTYSRAITQQYPRKCIYCGEVETTTPPDQSKLIESQAREIAELKQKHLMQLAGISTAAIGHFKDGDSIHPDYDTVALRDVTNLYSKYDVLFKERIELQSHINELHKALELAKPYINTFDLLAVEKALNG